MLFRSLYHPQEWRGIGVPTRVVARIAGKRGMPLYVMHNGRKIKEYKPEQSYKKGCLAYSIEGDHAWFYETEQVKRSISHLSVANNGSVDMSKPRQASEFESKRPPFKTWIPWLYDRQPGYYVTEDIEATRYWFLSEGISPRVQYRGSALRSLVVPSRKQYIFAEPKYAHSLSSWSGELATLGYECPYRGESLASYTHQVVMALVKNKRKKVSKAERDRVLAKYDHKCQACGDVGNTWDNVLQLDHPSPLRDHGEDRKSTRLNSSHR